MSSQAETADPGQPSFCARCGQATELRSRGGRERPQCTACGWVYYGKNALGAALAITSDDGSEILLVQRAHEPLRGWWMMPSGFVEYGECATETAVREAQEEVGLEVELTGLQGLYFGADDPRDVAHLAVYRARVAGGQLRAGDDAAAARFFKRDELPAKIAFEAQRQALAEWKRSTKAS